MIEDLNTTKNLETKTSRIRLDFSYDGTDFFGWQRQPNKPSVQETIETAILNLTKQTCPTTASGRTDAGVHALKQSLHFDFKGDDLTKFDWLRGLNRFLPETIRIRNAFQAPKEFHALRSSLEKTYLYQLQDSKTPNPLLSRYSHWVQSPIDLDYMKSLSECFIGNLDFASYMTQGTPVKTTVRDLREISWQREEVSGLVQVKFRGNGFLKQMVRNLMGTFLHGYWDKKLNPEDILKSLQAQSRQAAHGTAPALGLTLLGVKYPSELDNKCLKL